MCASSSAYNLDTERDPNETIRICRVESVYVNIDPGRKDPDPQPQCLHYDSHYKGAICP